MIDDDDLEARLRVAGQGAVNAMVGEDPLDTCAHVEATLLAVLAAHMVTGDVIATVRGFGVIHVELTELTHVDT